MDDVLKDKDHGVRLIYGRPEVVESELNRLADTYACTGLFYYVVQDRLEVAATMLHTREIRKAQFMQNQMPPGMRRQ